MIVSQLCGGLGNQMFQYALGYSVARKLRVDLRLDISPLETDPLRDYECDKFNISGKVIDKRELNGLLEKTNKKNIFSNFFRSRRPPSLKIVRESGFTFDPAILNKEGDLYLIGYWQSEKYFKAYRNDLLSEFQLKDQITEPRQVYLNAIKTATLPISIHVRRGDYVNNPSTLAYHGTCTPEWYQRAIDLIASESEQATFFVFSDDPTWCKTNIPHKGSMIFVEPQKDGHDIQDMMLMSQCHRQITANSSFSWWGAWLNQKMEKRVIVPKKWFGSAPHDTSDLLPADWERL